MTARESSGDSIAFFGAFDLKVRAAQVREHPDPTINFILVVALRQAFHHLGGSGRARSRLARPGPIWLSRFDLALGVWKDTSVYHEAIHPDLARNREFLAEIVEY